MKDHATNPRVEPARESPTPGAGVTPADLVELMRAFNDMTGRLQASHETLSAEVTRLNDELRSANEQVERSRRLAALGEMAAGIAHEIRNPLASIGLYAQMLERDLGELPQGADLARTARKIRDSARTVEGIVRDVLSFARELKVRREPVDATAILDKALEACTQEVRAVHGLHVHRAWDAGVDFTFQGDPALLLQALTNIVQNALQAMHSAGIGVRHVLTLSCERRRVVFGDGKRIEAMVFIVRDTGVGVTPEVVARMFNPFFTTREQGTGLGLAIVHRIIDAHAGRVVVRNNAEVTPAGHGADGQPPRGACVEVILPLALSVRGASPATHIATQASMTIMSNADPQDSTNSATSADRTSEGQITASTSGSQGPRRPARRGRTVARTSDGGHSR